MGRKSQQRKTGKTLEERVKQPGKYKHDDVVKEWKQKKRSQRVTAILFNSIKNSIRVGRTKEND